MYVVINKLILRVSENSLFETNVTVLKIYE